MHLLATLEIYQVIVFSVAILAVFVTLVFFCFFAWWLSHRPPSVSPYTKMPLRKASEIPYEAKIKVLKFLYYLKEYDNRIFEFRNAAVCRETGRIFPNAITWYGAIKVDWKFLYKRYPGKYVSWGALTQDQQEAVRDSHDTLEGFQTENSSSNLLPRDVEAKYAFEKPGPLYVDIETNVLLGWKSVPDTDLEVLIVQKPLRYITISVA